MTVERGMRGAPGVLSNVLFLDLGADDITVVIL